MLKVLILFIWWISDPFMGWETLSKLAMTLTYDELLEEEREVPVFSAELKEFEGKIVELEGFVIPLEKSGASDYFVLSRFPYNSCFFCGNAGPETVAEVYTEKKFNFSDQKVRVKGILKLNDSDPFHLFFILEDCEVIVL